MITKRAWKEWKNEIENFRIDDRFAIYRNRWKNQLFITTLVLIIFTPLIILTDISLLPLEIIYYFFEKWLER